MTHGILNLKDDNHKMKAKQGAARVSRKHPQQTHPILQQASLNRKKSAGHPGWIPGAAAAAAAAVAAAEAAAELGVGAVGPGSAGASGCC